MREKKTQRVKHREWERRMATEKWQSDSFMTDVDVGLCPTLGHYMRQYVYIMTVQPLSTLMSSVNTSCPLLRKGPFFIHTSLSLVGNSGRFTCKSSATHSYRWSLWLTIPHNVVLLLLFCVCVCVCVRACVRACVRVCVCVCVFVLLAGNSGRFT